MQNRSPSWLYALLLLGAPMSYAESIGLPPQWPALKESPVALPADSVRPLLMGGLRITLDVSTLDATRIAIGAGIAAREGSSTEALDWLCYTVSDTAPAQRVWLTSSELSRGRIDGVVAADLPAGSAAVTQCPELPPKFKPVRFGDGLWLGGLSTELRRTLGISAKTGAHFSSLFQGQSGNFDMVSSTAIEFRSTRAVMLHVAHSSKN